ncbi:SCO family protein [Sinimarinibacterium sp. CAU 1509]|uniref:SCO family protein n=1 Tax=Sinimarinibacterium sp. CAU 1509 TaxID=2562283 RepID=UPI0010ACC690|nr:SCO family protein [Sinimarinibacterium sp. CAU 1509]TJY58848.1 SCO family protein [Sinimarinibacterium sp. CAU 1509]
MRSIRRLLRAMAASCLAVTFSVTAQDLPDDSVYQLQVPLRTQADTASTLDRWRGHPVLVSMFYASCGYVCPLLIRSTQKLDRDLDAAVRRNLRVILVSFDPDHDTPEVLAALSAKHGIDDTRWMLARAEAGDVRKLAAVLGIQYRKLPDGGFNHATIISLLGPDGRVLATTSNPSHPEAEFVAALRATAVASKTPAAP